ncbi:hypothetical protein CFC21_109864 [Triticum aestivum]|uniref:Uncharacterized protein n=2 Tax=Triticum aestivum TaxID=4565 RepID=A0A9R1MLV5_WHEAT|nr:hypothetical protein CFC21_109863 [Triticum aestivum]KAF7109644.1 hypothetical protein CFC21_109864 [Triticum aestivum]
MWKSWCSGSAGGVRGSSSSDGSWRRRRRSAGPSVSMVADSSIKEEIVISPSDEEDQALPQQGPQLLKEAALTDEDFVCQIEFMTERSLHDMGPSPPSPERVKEDSVSPLHHHVKTEPASTHLPMKE